MFYSCNCTICFIASVSSDYEYRRCCVYTYIHFVYIQTIVLYNNNNTYCKIQYNYT